MSSYTIREQVAGILYDPQGNFLILKRNPKRYEGWGFVKGGIEKGETPEQALIREIFEEVGIVREQLNQIDDLAYTTAHYHEAKGFVGVVKWFCVQVTPGSFAEIKLESDEWVEFFTGSYMEVGQRLTWQTELNAFLKCRPSE